MTVSGSNEPLAAIANDLRQLVVATLCHTQAGHPGGSLSAAEIVATLFFSVMRLDPRRPDWEERDRFILSKGHAAPVYYAALARCGYFPEELLQTYDELDSPLQAHPDMQCPGVDMSSGSLGQGLSVGLGMALGLRLKAITARVFVVLGDGELQEGQVWEAAMAAPKFGADNLVAIVDDNRIQLMGDTAAIMPVDPIAEKWRAFNWHVLEVDGHNPEAIRSACAAAEQAKGRPTVILAHTVKGRGVSFMENTHLWHSAQITEDMKQKALAELCGREVRS
ncbi:MAG: transketolase [Thermoleophilia bacterium]